MRDDCSERMSEIDKVTPSIAFAAKSPDGADLTAVSVTMDGALLASRLDANAIMIDPGEHVFQLSSDGFSTVTKKLVVREFEKGRVETITFAPTPKVAPAPVPVPAPSPATSAITPPLAATSAPPAEAPPPTAPRDAERSGRKTLAYVLGAGGVVGIGLGTAFSFVAKSTYDDALKQHCGGSPTACDPDGLTKGATAHTEALVSTVGFIAGGALLAGGLVLYLTAPKNGSVNVQTTAGPSSAGLRVGGAR